MTTSIAEFRGRRKPSLFTTTLGETFELRPISLFSMLAAGAMPNDLTSQAMAIVNQTVSIRDTQEHAGEYARLINLMIISSVVEPVIAEGSGTKDALGIEEMDDQTKLELFTEIMKRYNRLEDQAGNPADLKTVPENAGGDAAGADGADVESEAERTGGDTAGTSGGPGPGHGDHGADEQAGSGDS